MEQLAKTSIPVPMTVALHRHRHRLIHTVAMAHVMEGKAQQVVLMTVALVVAMAHVMEGKAQQVVLMTVALVVAMVRATGVRRVLHAPVTVVPVRLVVAMVRATGVRRVLHAPVTVVPVRRSVATVPVTMEKPSSPARGIAVLQFVATVPRQAPRHATTALPTKMASMADVPPLVRSMRSVAMVCVMVPKLVPPVPVTVVSVLLCSAPMVSTMMATDSPIGLPTLGARARPTPTKQDMFPTFHPKLRACASLSPTTARRGQVEL